MDELLFHLGRTFEVFQIWMYDMTQKTSQVTAELEEALVVYMASPKITVAKETFRTFVNNLNTISAQAVAKVTRFADPDFYYALFRQYISHDFNRATLFACCIGFTVGSSVGLIIGVYLQSPKPPSVLMRAIGPGSYDPESITLLEDAFVPKIYRPDQVLVEVKFASIDSLDVRVSSGFGRRLRNIISRYNPNIHSELPFILGRYGSGIVVEIGANVPRIEIGSHVYFCTDFTNNGCLAEYALLDAADIAILPKSLGFEGAASLPQSAVTAWNAVVLQAGLSSKNAHSKKVFVHCGSTGCGWMVIQLCTAFGAQVTASSTNRAKGAVKALGAFTIYTVESGELLKHKNKYDVVINTVGPIATDFCSDLCLNSGIVVDAFQPRLGPDSFGIFSGWIYALWIKLSYGMFGVETWRRHKNGPILEEISKLVDRKLLQPFVDRTYYPEELDEAIQNLDTSYGTTLIRFENQRLNGFLARN